jgi:tRNA-(ms[2]io[6]A)-hydroxylase
MLGLKLVTDPMGKYSRIKYWRNFDRPCLVRTKAASNAISLITYNSELEELVTELLVMHEELEHLQMVHDLIKA